MKKNLIYLDKDEYKQFLISFDELKKKRRAVQDIKEKKFNSNNIDSWDLLEYKEINELENLLSLQINQKYKELLRIRFKSETNTHEEETIDTDNTIDDEIIDEECTNELFSEIEDNPEDSLNNLVDKPVKEKRLFIVNKIALYFSEKNNNNKTRKIRIR